MTQTLLKIQGAGMPPVMLDQCTQTLEAMPLGGLHRTVNGELIYTGVPGRMKYRTVCSGTGNGTPGLDALKRGDQVTVHCIQRLWQEATGERTILSRPAVVGTVLVMDENRQAVAFTMNSPSEVAVTPPLSLPLYLSYCPVLITRVGEIKLKAREWDGGQEWHLGMEEV
ncbi:MAG: hypothetical protein A2621_01945 [Alphaproteobacteria bacterium RIFCSPHIGHO2_01_FULL_41_14]|nr:MAG: hypothetical protein A2065_00530 [Alphaproteobacteria bacterium GWB1_45_5]OFW76566.1 MAG: hypothetical protein A3K20_00055 [Alphaproteobacteria bacterium GWA1_45_9]OFW89650.1 MAG: hypothetical protein A2621_01945 [Alphaproteobacteria bacterium RIFCSPHIGHO2_01_FULL_41_14]HCI49089.1 hypothetical protein [Holosporales bacterium]